MKRLGDATLNDLPSGIARPRYDRAAVASGIVHIGPGAFFRAHQASYVDDLLADDPRWGITAVSLKSPLVRDALTPQGGLYTLAELGADRQLRVIGALQKLVVAPEDPAAAFAALADPQTRLITLTVTEKGYHLTGEGALDEADLAIAHDLAYPQAAPISLTGWLARGLAARRASGAPSVTVMSCDNLEDNGGKLGRAVRHFADATAHRGLADWIDAEVRFPRTMVDSITPATDDALRATVDRALGLRDAWPVQREPFRQWVIEDDLAPGGPDLAAAGATLTRTVAPFEQAKLRLLNGAHSTLAYAGRLLALETVAEAMAHPLLAAFVDRLMRETIRPTLPASPDLGIDRYIDDVLARFRNPAMRHDLAQIAWDGSKKLPPRLLATAAELVSRGADLGPIAVPIAAWMRFIRSQVKTGAPLIDPMAAALTACLADDGPEEALRFLSLEAVFPSALAQAPAFRSAVLQAHAKLGDDPLEALRP